MNVIEHYIEEIYGETDVTAEFTSHVGHPPAEPLIRVDLLVNCYGIHERVQTTFPKTNWETIKAQGWYLA